MVDVPLKLRLVNEKALSRGTIYEPVPLFIELHNQSDTVIEGELTIEECDDFYIGGELKTFLPLMPHERYPFSYNVIPLQIGRLSLPKFSVAEVLDSGDRSLLIKGLTRKILITK